MSIYTLGTKNPKFPDTGKAHVRVFTPKDFLTPTYLEGIILPQAIFHYDNTFTHLRCTHFASISCTAVHLYCIPVSVRLYLNLCKDITEKTHMYMCLEGYLTFPVSSILVNSFFYKQETLPANMRNLEIQVARGKRQEVDSTGKR
jgi:hypothetical protein